MYYAIDVSKWQGVVNWASVKAAGVRHAYKGKRYICTAADGVAMVWDPDTYPDYWEEVEV